MADVIDVGLPRNCDTGLCPVLSFVKESTVYLTLKEIRQEAGPAFR